MPWEAPPLKFVKSIVPYSPEKARHYHEILRRNSMDCLGPVYKTSIKKSQEKSKITVDFFAERAILTIRKKVKDSQSQNN
jgi:hypothetical protein